MEILFHTMKTNFILSMTEHIVTSGNYNLPEQVIKMRGRSRHNKYLFLVD